VLVITITAVTMKITFWDMTRVDWLIFTDVS
jgi:hypothetical protein